MPDKTYLHALRGRHNLRRLSVCDINKSALRRTEDLSRLRLNTDGVVEVPNPDIGSLG